MKSIVSVDETTEEHAPAFPLLRRFLNSTVERPRFELPQNATDHNRNFQALINVGYRCSTPQRRTWSTTPSAPPNGEPPDRGSPAALFERSEFNGRPGWWSGARGARRAGAAGRPPGDFLRARFFGYFLAAQQESNSPAGARPGNPCNP